MQTHFLPYSAAVLRFSFLQLRGSGVLSVDPVMPASPGALTVQNKWLSARSVPGTCPAASHTDPHHSSLVIQLLLFRLSPPESDNHSEEYFSSVYISLSIHPRSIFFCPFSIWQPPFLLSDIISGGITETFLSYYPISVPYLSSQKTPSPMTHFIIRL